MTITTDHPDYDVVARSHTGCNICEELIGSAVALAMGSTGATVTDNRTSIHGVNHTVIVERVRCRRSGTDCLCPVCITARNA